MLNLVVPPNGFETACPPLPATGTMSGGKAPAALKSGVMSIKVFARLVFCGSPLIRTLLSARTAESWRTVVLVLAAVPAC